MCLTDTRVLRPKKTGKTASYFYVYLCLWSWKYACRRMHAHAYTYIHAHNKPLNCTIDYQKGTFLRIKEGKTKNAPKKDAKPGAYHFCIISIILFIVFLIRTQKKAWWLCIYKSVCARLCHLYACFSVRLCFCFCAVGCMFVSVCVLVE